MTPQHYIWFVLYDLSLMTIEWKVPHQALNDYLWFASHPLQLKASKSYMSGMTTKLVIYEVTDLRIYSNVIGYSLYSYSYKTNLFLFIKLKN
jgi:hypothetical protein